MSLCNAIHPERPEIACNRPGTGPQSNHPDHTGSAPYDLSRGLNAPPWLDWPNEAYEAPPERKQYRKGVKPASKNKGLLKDMASRTQGNQPYEGT